MVDAEVVAAGLIGRVDREEEPSTFSAAPAGTLRGQVPAFTAGQVFIGRKGGLYRLAEQGCSTRGARGTASLHTHV